MKLSENSPAEDHFDGKMTNRELFEHHERLVAFEILTRCLTSCYYPMGLPELQEKTGLGPKTIHLIIGKLKTKYGRQERRGTSLHERNAERCAFEEGV
jgi:hypothetical protein